MAIFKMDKTKQREVRNAAIVAVSAAASDGLFDYIKVKFGTAADGSETLIGKHANLAQAAGGVALLAVAPRKRGMAKDLAENIALGLIVSGIYAYAIDTLDIAKHVRGLLPENGLSGYAPRQLAAPALGAYSSSSVSSGSLSTDTAPVI